MASLWFVLFSSLCLLRHHGTVETISEEKEYECVDISKQPAFQHPLMKDHQIQMRPSVEFQAMLSMDSETPDLSSDESEERCPNEQVPIHRPKTNYTNNFTQLNKIITEANLHYAIIRPLENPRKRWWHGAQAVFNIYKPHVLKDQFSKAWIWLNHREKDVISSIQFGWAVHTGLYQDDRPRLTTYWISDRHQEGCYNALCRGGYVQVHKTIFPGMVFENVTVSGKKQYSIHLLVGQDKRTKNWLLMTRSTLIGYWPYQIYSMQGASQVYFGGYVGGLAGAPSPAMGAGDFPKEIGIQRKYSCFMKQLKYFEGSRLVDIDSNEFEEYVDSPKCYGVWFRKFEEGNGEMITFGGPGGECGI